MGTKRLYVAVGSVSVKSLIELIGRYQDEGLYKETKDMFIGLDTDSGRVKDLQSLDSTDEHILAIQVVDEPGNSSVRDVIGSFRKDWDKTAHIKQTGVGGDRKLSFSTLRWTQNVEFQKRVASLTKDDELILIGTAFGGTSTGMFWNLAMWLRSKIRLDSNGHRAEFYAFVVLPGDQGGDLSKYPWSYNLCAFMQDMQALDLSSRVHRRMQVDIPYIMPLYPLYDPSVSKDLLPVWSEDKYGASDHCFLPCDRLFLVPTPSADIGAEAFVPDILAEQAFVLGALNGWQDFRVSKQTIDLMNTSHGVDYTLPDRAFGGFNMVAGRSARRAVLSSVYWKKFSEQYTLFVSPGVKASTPEAVSIIRNKALAHIKNQEHSRSLVEPRQKQFDRILDDRRMSASEKAGTLDQVIREVQTTLATQQYTWVSFIDFVRLCFEWVQPTLLDNPDTFVTLADIYDIYADVRDDIVREATQFDEVRQKILWLPGEQVRIELLRCKKLATKSLGASESVSEDVRSEFQRAEKEYFQWFVACCRAQATRNQLASDADIAVELKALCQSYEQKFGALLAQRVTQPQSSSLPSCIYQDDKNKGNVADSLTVERGRYLSILLECVKSDEAGILDKAERGERSCVVALGEQASSRGPANPLRKIQLELSSGPSPSAFSDVFRVDDAKQWHCHFFIKYGSVAPITWGQLGSFSQSFHTFQLLLQGKPYAAGQNIEPSELKGEHYFSTVKNVGESQGVWIGTLQLDSEIRNIIHSAYERYGKPINIWQSKAFSSVKDGSPQRSLLTLHEQLAFGIILGCIDEYCKNQKTLGSDGCEIQIGGGKSSFKISANDVALYFAHVGKAEREYRMVNINTAWISPLMSWINGTFWADVDMEPFYNSLIEMDRSILNKMTLSISADEFRKPMIELAKRVKGMVHVNLS